MLSIFRTVESKVKPQPVAPTEERVQTIAPIDIRPPLPAVRFSKSPADPRHEEYLNEYAELAAVVGIEPPDLVIESFKGLLLKLDIPIFNLSEVISYMDDKAAKESKHQAGWEWRALRARDDRSMRFGRAFEHSGRGYSPPTPAVPASDYYAGHGTAVIHQWIDRSEGATEEVTRQYDKKAEQQVYDRTIPLHAVRRIAAIEREFKGDVAFFVSDYALMPEVRYPDPFLMAVIPNINVANGTGRFVIDFWDEPGFGIEQMLK